MPDVEAPWLHKIMNAYADQGYPQELIASWALPSRDADTLVQLIGQQQPEKVLEIGTFVGVSTLMMASKLREGAMVHTIDPNFPLSVELAAMNTPTGEADSTVRHQELASVVAQQLGLSHKITFHAGGFSTSATFASTKQDASKTVPVIGPKVCEAEGPFDFIFIDGLHYTDAVLSDLRLASRYLRHGGRIVLHDVIGMWGSNVRRAVFRFLSETPGFSFRHGRYADIFDAIGVLEYRVHGQRDAANYQEHAVATSLLDRTEFVSNLVSITTNICAPHRVVYIGQDSGGLLSQLARSGVEELCHIDVPAESEADLLNESPVAWREVFDFHDVYKPSGRFDLCVLLDPTWDWGDERVEHLIGSCVACSDTILFGATPPGEVGVASPGSRPLAWWVRRFWRHGYVFHDVIRPWLEPLKFSYSFSPIYEVTSSELANLYLIRRQPFNGSNGSFPLEDWLVEKEGRTEDLALQTVFSDILIQHLLKKSKEAQDLVAEQNGRLRQISREHEEIIEERDARLRQIESHVQECQRALQHTEQSLEYRVARWLGSYPGLLRAFALLYRLFRRGHDQ